MSLNKSLACLCALMLILSLLLCGCSKVPSMREKDGKYTQPKSGVTYLEAPGCYRASSYVKDRVVAKIENEKIDDNLLYAINDEVSAEKMLTTDDFRLFYAEGTTLPTLQEMAPHQIQLGQSDAITATYAIIKLAEDVNQLVDLYTQGPSFPSSAVVWVIMDYEKYELRFESTQYPGLHYYLEYYSCKQDVIIQEEIADPNDFAIRYDGAQVSVEEWKGVYYATYNFGKGILIDRETGRCYPAGDLVDSYLTGATGK
ncbi:MAG: hypothetical protein IJX62_06620 [Clostridia bacterium]|nr:hypothetical protein [Clostridia bacterium]